MSYLSRIRCGESPLSPNETPRASLTQDVSTSNGEGYPGSFDPHLRTATSHAPVTFARAIESRHLHPRFYGLNKGTSCWLLVMMVAKTDASISFAFIPARVNRNSVNSHLHPKLLYLPLPGDILAPIYTTTCDLPTSACLHHATSAELTPTHMLLSTSTLPHPATIASHRQPPTATAGIAVDMSHGLF